MLTCNCSPELNTKGENIGAKGFRTRKLTLYVGIEQYQRMQVSVAGMKDIGHPQAILLR